MVEKIQVDYIVVGCGLAGIAFAETCLSNKKSIFVFDNGSQNSSTIAAGIYNPVILKRFSGLEHAQEQLHSMNQFYHDLQHKLNKNFDNKIPVLRKFVSIEEQNNWFAASDKESMSAFLSTKFYKNKITGFPSPFNYGEVLQTGFVDTEALTSAYKNYLQHEKWYSNQEFDHHELQINENSVTYKSILAKHIVFAEGFGLHANPYFNNLPLDGTKGEIIIIEASGLKLNYIINSSLYIVPLGNSLFKVGATYNWASKTCDTTDEGLQELIAKLNGIINCEYTIVSHFAGIRPTVKDRKPLLGTHHTHSQIHILNGLGTRGVMLGPWCAKKLYNHIENGIDIERTHNITRFYNRSN